jgi:chromosome segregation ATPase
MPQLTTCSAWVSEEQERLTAYTSEQLAHLKKQREELVAWQTEVEAELLGREHELARQALAVTSRARDVDQRENQLQEAKATLEGDREAVVQATMELQALQEAEAQIRTQIEAERTALRQLTTEKAQVSQRLESLRTRERALQEQLLSMPAEIQLRREQVLQREADAQRVQLALQRQAEENNSLKTRLQDGEAELYKERLDLQRQAQLLREREARVDRNPLTAEDVTDQAALNSQLVEARQQIEQLRAHLQVKRQENKTLRVHLAQLINSVNRQPLVHETPKPSDAPTPKSRKGAARGSAVRGFLAAVFNGLDGTTGAKKRRPVAVDTDTPNGNRPAWRG